MASGWSIRQTNLGRGGFRARPSCRNAAVALTRRFEPGRPESRWSILVSACARPHHRGGGIQIPCPPMGSTRSDSKDVLLPGGSRVQGRFVLKIGDVQSKADGVFRVSSAHWDNDGYSIDTRMFNDGKPRFRNRWQRWWRGPGRVGRDFVHGRRNGQRDRRHYRQQYRRHDKQRRWRYADQWHRWLGRQRERRCDG